MAFSENDVPNLGFYNWNVVDNCLTGDAIFASLYGFTLDEVVRGVTIEDVMARIIPGDRERVAFEVHTGILSGEAGSTCYTVFDGFCLKKVMSIGRCLHDTTGLPSFYTGTIFERPDRQQDVPTNVSGHNVVPFQRLSRLDGPAP